MRVYSLDPEDDDTDFCTACKDVFAVIEIAIGPINDTQAEQLCDECIRELIQSIEDELT